MRAAGGPLRPPANRRAAMLPIRLRPGISHRSFEGCAIVLDVQRDRYWQVSGRVAAALDRIANAEDAMPADDVACLDALGLVEAYDGAAPTDGRISLPEPAASATEGTDSSGRFRAVEALEVARLTVAARRRVRRYPLHRLLGDVERRRAGRRQIDASDAGRLARRFHRYRGLVPLAALCLPDTLAFLDFAAHRGCFPNMVFGVEAWPFAAHCWAQHGDIVLNDALDHARAFAPILIL